MRIHTDYFFSFLGIDGIDSFVWITDKSHTFRNSENPAFVAWIHSHVNGNECFLSSIDVHTQAAFQNNVETSLAIVVQIDEVSLKNVCYYQLTKAGKMAADSCKNLSGHHETCHKENFFSKISHVDDTRGPFRIVDARQQQLRCYQMENEERLFICKACSKQFPSSSILKHIKNYRSPCKSFFTENEICNIQQQTSKISKQKKLEKMKQSYDNMPLEEKQAMQEKNKEQNAEKYAEKKEEIKSKVQDRYYQKRKEILAKKREEYKKDPKKTLEPKRKKYNDEPEKSLGPKRD